MIIHTSLFRVLSAVRFPTDTAQAIQQVCDKWNKKLAGATWTPDHLWFVWESEFATIEGDQHKLPLKASQSWLNTQYPILNIQFAGKFHLIYHYCHWHFFYCFLLLNNETVESLLHFTINTLHCVRVSMASFCSQRSAICCIRTNWVCVCRVFDDFCQPRYQAPCTHVCMLWVCVRERSSRKYSSSSETHMQHAHLHVLFQGRYLMSWNLF